MHLGDEVIFIDFDTLKFPVLQPSSKIYCIL